MSNNSQQIKAVGPIMKPTEDLSLKNLRMFMKQLEVNSANSGVDYDKMNQDMTKASDQIKKTRADLDKDSDSDLRQKTVAVETSIAQLEGHRKALGDSVSKMLGNINNAQSGYAGGFITFAPLAKAMFMMSKLQDIINQLQKLQKELAKELTKVSSDEATVDAKFTEAVADNEADKEEANAYSYGAQAFIGFASAITAGYTGIKDDSEMDEAVSNRNNTQETINDLQKPEGIDSLEATKDSSNNTSQLKLSQKSGKIQEEMHQREENIVNRNHSSQRVEEREMEELNAAKTPKEREEVLAKRRARIAENNRIDTESKNVIQDLKEQRIDSYKNADQKVKDKVVQDLHADTETKKTVEAQLGKKVGTHQGEHDSASQRKNNRYNLISTVNDASGKAANTVSESVNSSTDRDKAINSFIKQLAQFIQKLLDPAPTAQQMNQTNEAANAAAAEKSKLGDLAGPR